MSQNQANDQYGRLKHQDLSTLDLIPAQIAVLDREGNIVSTNETWRATAQAGCLGSAEQWNYLQECRAAAARGSLEASAVEQGLLRVLEGREPNFVKTYPCAFESKHHWFQVMVSRQILGGEPVTVVMHVDVTALQHDPLTGLPNRALFEAQVQHVLDLSSRANTSFCVTMIDLDEFKPINDTYGHLAGDYALASFAKLLSSCVGERDTAARVGGDEFGVVFAPGTTADAEHVFETALRTKLLLRFDYAGHALSLGASVGTAAFPMDGSDVETLIGVADMRMYANKRRHSGARVRPSSIRRVVPTKRRRSCPGVLALKGQTDGPTAA